ncbi:MAG TPA: LysR family transcriptional regulator [Steroidobacteraceae bacterium]|jgi:DNA-binding transcriptional LysR family regulator|nr:LysR family transcriptional regulator [Steroidobacteraceae bacterium]
MYSFTFRQIEVFLQICRAGNFSGAAGQLNVSQPAISNVIRTLEAQLGVELFERRRGASCVLTREGMAFRDSAQHFVSQCEALSRAARPGRRRPRSLRVFIGGHLLEDFVRPMLPEFYEEHPQLQMNFLPERSRDQILQDIQTGKIDVAVMTVAPDERPPGSLLIGTVTAGVYGARNFRGPFTAETIAALPFFLPAAGTQLTASMLRELEKHGVVPARVVAFCPYHDVRISLVCRGQGVTFSVQSVIESHDRGAQLKLLFPMTPWERRLYINPRVEAASATALASFVTRALSRSVITNK